MRFMQMITVPESNVEFCTRCHLVSNILYKDIITGKKYCTACHKLITFVNDTNDRED